GAARPRGRADVGRPADRGARRGRPCRGAVRPRNSLGGSRRYDGWSRRARPGDRASRVIPTPLVEFLQVQMIELEGVLFKEIVEHALREFPNEACGLVAGNGNGPV